MPQHSSPYAPIGESPYTLFVETAWLEGALLTSMAYGIAATFFVMCFHLLLRQRNGPNRRMRLAYLAYISLIFTMGTIYYIPLLVSTQESFIDNRNYPGGPSAYEDVIFAKSFDMMGNAAYVVSTILADGLMVSTCFLCPVGLYHP